MLSVADGVGIVTENLFAGRFRYVDELRRLGADIRTDAHHAVVRGVPRLSGAPVRAHDIRAGAALVVAGLVAEGETTISDVHHIDRGYDDMVGQLRSRRRVDRAGHRPTDAGLPRLRAPTAPPAAAPRRRRSGPGRAASRPIRPGGRAPRRSRSSIPPQRECPALPSTLPWVGNRTGPPGSMTWLPTDRGCTGCMRTQVEQTIEVIRPALQADGGDIILRESTRQRAS